MSCAVSKLSRNFVRCCAVPGMCVAYAGFTLAQPAPSPEPESTITIQEVPATAVKKPPLDAEDLPLVVKNLSRHGVEVVGQFTAPGGLQAYAGIAQQQPLAIYLTPDKKHVIVGTMMDEQGADVTQAALEQATIGPWTAQTWDALADSAWVADGSNAAEHVVYMFTDPNCPYCHRFWSQARPWVDSGKVQIRHILVGVLTESSPGKAAAILAAEDPQKALLDHENAGTDNGIAPLSVVPAAVAAKLEQNSTLMEQLQIQGTPGIFYFDSKSELQVQRGAPLDEDLERILGPR